MKTAISIPDPVFKAAERLSKRLGVSRSQLYAEAVGEYLREHGSLGVTECLDRVYAVENKSATLDPVLEILQGRSLPKEDW
jgi:antitoxin MazE6